jgi:hypothetical protein
MTEPTDELVERLRAGVVVVGTYDDNGTDVVDVRGADEAMFKAADRIEAQAARIAELEVEREALLARIVWRLIGGRWRGIKSIERALNRSKTDDDD